MNLIYFSVFCFVLFTTIIKYKKIFNLKNFKYIAIQKIHDEYVPPYGGVPIFICFYLYLYTNFSDSYLLYWYVLFPAFFIFFTGLVEDITNRVKPLLRFLVIFIGSLIFCINIEKLPSIEIWFIGDLINQNYVIQILFYSLCLTAISNGTNMVDGMNGLSGLTILFIFLSLLSLVTLFELNIQTLEYLFPLVVFIFIFLFFNFPFGKIFLGDAGAYWLGWLVGVIILYIYTKFPLNTWGAVVILFYPSIEVIFSTIRKILSSKNPLKPDLLHIHLKLFFAIKGPTPRNKNFNSLTTLCLMPFWSTPPLAIIWSKYYQEFNILFLIVMTFFYCFYYFLIPTKK